MDHRTFFSPATDIVGPAITVETTACSPDLHGHSGSAPTGGRSGATRSPSPDDRAVGRTKGHVALLPPEDYQVPGAVLRRILLLMLAQAHHHAVTRAS
ncbi:MAG: hypothetical protein NVSMB16_07540 [Acidimicrobiales bacterium]